MSKCAPGKNFTDNSCYTLDDLIKIAQEYNKIYNNSIEIVNDKKTLLKSLVSEMKKTYDCDDQVCWLNTNIMKNLSNVKKYTFRPEGPKSKYKWLSTSNINDVMYQYENIYPKFKFLGAVPYDFEELDFYDFKKLNLNNFSSMYPYFGMVINLDPHYKSGSHWVSLYGDFNKKHVYFFDSFGNPPRKKIRKFIRKLVNFMYTNQYNKKINFKSVELDDLKDFRIKFNHKQHQFKNSECGVYSMNFIIRLLKKETFDEIVNEKLDDKFMNSCRNVYFRN
jgi:hypothetical protein